MEPETAAVVTLADLAHRYLVDRARLEERYPTPHAKLQLLDSRLHSDVRGRAAVLDDAHGMNRLWVPLALSHTRQCWDRLADPGATCSCRDWSRQ